VVVIASLAFAMAFVFRSSAVSSASAGQQQLSRTLEWVTVLVLGGGIAVVSKLSGAKPSKGTAYAITDRRIISVTGGRSGEARSVLLVHITETTVRKRLPGWYEVAFSVPREVTARESRTTAEHRRAVARGWELPVFERLAEGEETRQRVARAIEAAMHAQTAAWPAGATPDPVAGRRPPALIPPLAESSQQAGFAPTPVAGWPTAAPVTQGEGRQPAQTPPSPVNAPASLSAPIPGYLHLGPGEQPVWSARPLRAPWHFGLKDLAKSLAGLSLLSIVRRSMAVSVHHHGAVLVVTLQVLLVAAGLYYSAGRLIQRRLRIQRATHVLTTQRLITTWRLGRRPVIVQKHLAELMPMQVSGRNLLPQYSVSQRAARRDDRSRGKSKVLYNSLRPMQIRDEPALIELADPEAVLSLIHEHQLRALAPV
jgi:hypothetical protein